MKQIVVNKNQAGQRLDKLLTKYLNKAPKSFIYKMLRKKNITLNGKRATGSEHLVERDKIELFLSDETIENFSEVKFQQVESNLRILYEDEHILLVNKPVGILSQKASAGDVSMVEHILSYLLETNQLKKEELAVFRPSICNRLDRNTSGILIAGKSLKGLQDMAELLKKRSLHKYYRCIVTGKLTQKQEIQGYLVKDEKKNKVFISQERQLNSELILTEYKPLIVTDQFTYLEVKLITGRSHQIRAHLASIGHPIAGDFKYGHKETNQKLKQLYGLQSQLLHSHRLEFPENCPGILNGLAGKTITAPLPRQFQDVLMSENLQ